MRVIQFHPQRDNQRNQGSCGGAHGKADRWQRWRKQPPEAAALLLAGAAQRTQMAQRPDAVEKEEGETGHGATFLAAAV
ncbi:hypothetical protein AOR01nite_04320 [Acetobacter orleanensis]|uniref:Uncharacterized protein n=1 Tax=Acetobacter orleanensis TaxID=104099 RepID=A0A4Y3TMA0_9PROT|nr:hypothetical protein Abol_014_172 [Acetobacter orleanensis JCM 7639]GEB81955.1 hypothetical protein AOR01nite_04320 [Acetobacter orleanensis]